MVESAGWFEVSELRGDVYRIREGAPQLPCHSYLIDDEQPFLIDTGLGIGDLRGLVEDIAGRTPTVVLTHAHWDHLGAAHAFEEVYVHPRERHDDGTISLDVFADRFDHRPGIFIEEWLTAGRVLPDGFDPESYTIEPLDSSRALCAGDRLELDGRALEVVEVPGHSPGQIALVDRTAGTCFGGDVLEPGGTIYAHFAGCDLEAYRASLRRLIERRDEGAFEVLLTGHGDPIEDLSILDNALEVLAAILADELDYDLVDTHWGPSRQYEHGGLTVLTAE